MSPDPRDASVLRHDRDPVRQRPAGGTGGLRQTAERLDGVLVVLLDACAVIARELQPFLPAAATRVGAALRELDAEKGRSLFRKLEVPS